MMCLHNGRIPAPDCACESRPGQLSGEERMIVMVFAPYHRVSLEKLDKVEPTLWRGHHDMRQVSRALVATNQLSARLVIRPTSSRIPAALSEDSSALD